MASNDNPLEEHDRDAIIELLEPWTMTHSRITISAEKTSNTINVMANPFFRSDDNSVASQRQAMLHCRQTMELVRLVMALDPTMLYDLVQVRLFGDYYGMDEQKFLCGDRQSSVQLRYDYQELCRHHMEQHLDVWYTGIPPSTEPPFFHAVRDDLHARLVSANRLDQLEPAVVRIDVLYSPGIFDNTPVAFKDIIPALARFSQLLYTPNTGGALPSIGLKVDLNVRMPTITSELVVQMQEMAQRGVSFEAHIIELHPSWINSTEDELAGMLSLVVSKSTKLSVAISNENRDKRRLVLRSLAKFAQFRKVKIDGSRSCNQWKPILTDLFELALSRSPPLCELYCRSRIHSWRDRDTSIYEPLNDFVKQWKASHPDKKLAVDYLELYGYADGVLPVFAQAFDDVTRISVCGKDEAAFKIPSSVVTKSTANYRNLMSIELCDAQVATMDIFSESMLPLLRTIKLVGVEVCDRFSLTQFLQDLEPHADGRTRKLCEMKLAGSCLELDEDETVLLESVFQKNRHLKDVACYFKVVGKGTNRDSFFNAQKKLKQHDGDIVFAPLSGQELHQVVSQRCAFLSAISGARTADGGFDLSRLDALVVRAIFGFGAPHAKRSVARC